MTMKALLKTSFVAAALAALTACEGIGDGNRPESFFISVEPADGSAFEMIQCLRVNVAMVGEFTNGARGNFTARATWTSNNPDVLMVSDGDIVLPESGNAQLAKGTLIPVQPGTATVTATFLDQAASLLVDVSALGDVRVEPAASTTAIGARRSQTVFADIEGEDLNLAGFTRWTFDEAEAVGDDEEDPTTAIAELNPVSGEITGVGAGSLTSRTILDFCGIEATAAVEVAPIDSLVLAKEFDDRNELITATTEIFEVTAQFANGDEQVLTSQADYISSREEVAAFDLTEGVVNALRGLMADPAPVEVTARFDQTPDDVEDEDFVFSAPIDVTIVDAELNSLAVTPQTLELVGNDDGNLIATGTFDDGARTQLITRHVTWTSDNAAVLVSNAGVSAGAVASIVDEDNTATITATRSEVADDGSVTTFSDSATVNVTATPEDDGGA